MTRPWAVSQYLAAIAIVAASTGARVVGKPTLIAAAAFSVLLQSAHAQSYDWGAMAIVSGTMGVNANQICIGEGTRGDIGCPTYAPSVTTAGLEVSGTVSATRFVGDGSGLTGIAANVSVTTGASGSLVYRDQFGSLFASSGLSISSTTGSVGIGAGAPSWLGSNGLYATGGIATSSSLYLGSGGNIYWGNAVTKIYGAANSANDNIAFTVSNTEAMRIVSTGYVGIGTSTPSTTLHLVGGAGGGDILRLARSDAGTSWAMGLGNGGLSVYNETPYGQGRALRFFLNSVGLLVGGLANAPESIPSQTLHVSGTVLTTSWTGINFGSALKVTPTAPLEVSGTVSATRFVGDGSGLTGITGGASTFASLTDVSYSSVGGNIFGPGSLSGAVNGVATATAFGVGALSSGSNSGSSNSAFGSNALRSNTTGSWNVAVGRTTLTNNTTGNSNVALGVSALTTNTAGSFNTAVGGGALSASGGSFNTSLGYASGQSLASGGSNTLIGYNAGGGITSGNTNIVIGAGLSPYSNTGSNQLNLGNVLFGDLGLGSTLQGKLGVNVTSPTAALEVSGSVGIGTSNPSATLHVQRSGGSGFTGWPVNARTVAVFENGNAAGTAISIVAKSTSPSTGSVFFGTGANEARGQISYINAEDAIRTIVNSTMTNNVGTYLNSNGFIIGQNVAYPSATLHVSGTAILSGFTAVNLNRTAVAPLEVSGTISATRFVGDGSGLTGVVAAANDNIVSGSAYVKAQQDTGALVSGSLTVSGTVSATTLQLANGPTDPCTTANGGALKRVGNRFYFCRP